MSATSDDDAPGWPLHQRLSGVAARTVAVGLALLPAVALLANKALEALMILGLSLVFVAPLLAAERRDLGVMATLFRQLLASALGMALVPVAFVSFQHVGQAPDAAYAQMAQLIDLRTLISVLIGAPVASVLLGVLFAVRVRTSRVGPQVLAGLMIPAVVMSAWMDAGSRSPWRPALLLLLSGVLVPLALVGAERLMARRDPRAPRPVERDPRPCFALFGVTLLLLSLLPALGMQAFRRSYLELDFNPSGPATVAEIAEKLRGLGAEGVSRSPAQLLIWMNVPNNGYLVRVLVAGGGSRWCVIADPLDPARAPGKSWLGDHTGAVVSCATPVSIDAEACTARSGGRRK